MNAGAGSLSLPVLWLLQAISQVHRETSSNCGCQLQQAVVVSIEHVTTITVGDTVDDDSTWYELHCAAQKHEVRRAQNLIIMRSRII